MRGPPRATWTNGVIAGILSLHACPARCGARRRCGTAKLCSAPCLPLRAGTLLRHPSPRQAAHATQRLIAPNDMSSPISNRRHALRQRFQAADVTPPIQALRAGFARVRAAIDTYSRPCPLQPAGKGFLTGSIGADATFVSSDLRSRIPRFEPDALKVNLTLVDLLGRIAARKGATSAQVALAWLLAPEAVDRSHPRHYHCSGEGGS
jgi:hypothetical protein